MITYILLLEKLIRYHPILVNFGEKSFIMVFSLCGITLSQYWVYVDYELDWDNIQEHL